MKMKTPISFLGGLTAEQFLSEYWQKKPLLVRGAFPDVGPHADLAVLSALAQRDDVESRLIESRAGRWFVESGPLRPSRLARLPESDWTLLVQNVNHHLPHIADLLWQFDFLPYARIDDLMISYAPPGGTVGPHFDSYDVFLLQVGGRKRWQIGSPDNQRLQEGAPIKVLDSFTALDTWELAHGDMLYLPPKLSHYGVALDAGMTYSVGFRAPTVQEMATQFLVHLQDSICLDGMYADPGLRPVDAPARIGDDMVEQVAAMLERIHWDRDTVADFLGRYLSEPKPHVFYEGPDAALDFDAFADAVVEQGVRLDLKSQILFTDDAVYANGERLETGAEDAARWQQFGNARHLAGAAVSDGMLDALYEGYEAGYWQLGESRPAAD
ncbi:cupin domain-containing protein [Microvirgula aerodenitrificans]|uniref:cupin domain-containing protein n=2 Tax=Microvirgula aerodenitrificans TaxID=57480 RepID=UPI0028E2F688|nr:cupin domain-containing protein [Microvirgula aerodenitrificans]